MSSVLETSRVGLHAEPARSPRRSGRRVATGAVRGAPLRAARLLGRWNRLALGMQAQLQSQWCWAAVSTSVSRFFDPASAWTQCGVVGAELGQATCCQDGSTASCNQPWYLDRALARTGNLAGWRAGALGMAAIRRQIRSGRPVGVRVGWAGGGGHFLVIAGYRGPLEHTVEVRDSIYGTSQLTLETLGASYQGSGSWTHTYSMRP